MARGAPFGPDDGTISPWAVVTSLPFAPEIVIETIRHVIERLESDTSHPIWICRQLQSHVSGHTNNLHGWVSPWIFGLNEGPVIMMIENFHTDSSGGLPAMSLRC